MQIPFLNAILLDRRKSSLKSSTKYLRYKPYPPDTTPTLYPCFFRLIRISIMSFINLVELNISNFDFSNYNPGNLTSNLSLTGYSNFFINHDKRALSGEKNYRPNNAFYSPNINKNDTINILGNNNSKYILNNNNQILRSNFAPTSPNPTAIPIKRTPQDGINTNNYKNHLNMNSFFFLRCYQLYKDFLLFL